MIVKSRPVKRKELILQKIAMKGPGRVKDKVFAIKLHS